MYFLNLEMYFQVTKIVHLLYNLSSVIWLLRLLHLVGCICLNLEVYLSQFWNVFSKICKCIFRWPKLCICYTISSVIWLLRLLHLVGCQPRSINICCFESTLLTRLHCTHFCISRFLYFVFQWICMFVFSNVSSRPSQLAYTALTFVFLCFCILYFSEFVCLYFQFLRVDPPNPPHFLYFSVFVFLNLYICICICMSLNFYICILNCFEMAVPTELYCTWPNFVCLFLLCSCTSTVIFFTWQKLKFIHFHQLSSINFHPFAFISVHFIDFLSICYQFLPIFPHSIHFL